MNSLNNKDLNPDISNNDNKFISVLDTETPMNW